MVELNEWVHQVKYKILSILNSSLSLVDTPRACC